MQIIRGSNIFINLLYRGLHVRPVFHYFCLKRELTVPGLSLIAD